jgi:hypothetical protein
MTEIKNFPVEKLHAFFSKQPISKAYLFGSHAKGLATPQSDIDFLVEVDKGTDLFTFIRIKQLLEKLLKQPVDLISANGISPRLKPTIDAEKILIYERKTL